MGNHKGSENLKRGGITAEGRKKGLEKMQAVHAADRELEDASKGDPYAAYAEIHAMMTRHIVKLLRAEARTGDPPGRDVTDRLREYRQLTDALNEYRRTQAESDSARELFARMEAALATANLEERTPEPPPCAA